VSRGAWWALALVLLALASGCGDGKQAAPPVSTQAAANPKDPGLDAVTRMASAIRAHDRAALWTLLSEPSRRRLGPTLGAFSSSRAPGLERDLRYLSSHRLREVVSERITGRFGLVAVASGQRTFTTPLRLEHGKWKLELGGGPLAIRVLGPDPGSVGRVNQIAYEIRGTRGGATAVLYADGITLRSKEAVGPKTATVYANLDAALTPGAHNAVAFATNGSAAAARTWTFVAR
jgi:hypothetical protein